jgi:hypothetical protein
LSLFRRLAFQRFERFADGNGFKQGVFSVSMNLAGSVNSQSSQQNL